MRSARRGPPPGRPPVQRRGAAVRTVDRTTKVNPVRRNATDPEVGFRVLFAAALRGGGRRGPAAGSVPAVHPGRGAVPVLDPVAGGAGGGAEQPAGVVGGGAHRLRGGGAMSAGRPARLPTRSCTDSWETEGRMSPVGVFQARSRCASHSTPW